MSIILRTTAVLSYLAVYSFYFAGIFEMGASKRFIVNSYHRLLNIVHIASIIG